MGGASWEIQSFFSLGNRYSFKNLRSCLFVLMTRASKYNHCLDFIKGIACICVIFMHCEFPGKAGIAVQAISRFCVPFFFMVSGYFSYYPGREQYDADVARKKISHIGQIVLWATLFYLCFAFVLAKSIIVIRQDLFNFAIFNKPFIVVGQLWFLYALLYVYIAFRFIWKRNRIKSFYYIAVILFIVYICLAQGAHLCGILVPNIYYRNWLIEGLPFFFAGHWIHANQERIKISDKVLVLIVLVSTLLCLVERRIMGRDFGVNIMTIPQVFSLFIYAVLFPDRHKGVIQEIGKRYSMWVYILHIFVFLSLDKFYHHWGVDTVVLIQWFRPVITVIITLLLSCVCYAILQRSKIQSAS